MHPRARGGDAALFGRRRVLPGGGQGPGEVRDAAGARGGRGQRDRGRGGARVLTGGVLSGGGGVRTSRDDRAARRAARPTGAGEDHAGDPGVPGAGPGRGVWCGPGRPGGRPGSASSCIGARWNGSGGNRGRRGRGRAFWPVGEAAQADYEALRAHVPGRSGSVDVAVRGPVRPPRTRRADRLAGGRTGVHRPGAGRCATAGWSPHDDPRLDALAAGFAFLLGVDDRPRDRRDDGGRCDESRYLRAGLDRQPATAGHDRLSTGRAAGSGSQRRATSWSQSSATTGTPAPGWTGPGWTACGTPPRPG